MATTESAQRSGEQARTKIIGIALQHFGQHGYRGGSLARIAAEAGISQSGLLHHFGTKAALLQAVLGARDIQDLVATGTSLEDFTEMDFDALLDFLVRVVRNNVNSPDLVRLAHLVAAEASGPDHPAYDWVAGRFRFLQTLIGDALGRSIDAGTVRADVDSRGITEWLIAMAEGLENQWLLDPEVDMVGSFERFVVELRRLVAVLD
ncbi:TetR/AcrR family transcriptional regulator [Nocardia sp. NPDC052001]|uniref:TetR/AcrR family transcriptional regulator n=1 Tax=Nocardia sp. NPDC052001 TaxID=3154853 RepID=UPI003447BF5F